MWTLDSGRNEVEKVQQLSRCYGYHVALGGGVLNSGRSDKDLDLYFLPLDNQPSEPRTAALVRALNDLWGACEPINDAKYAALSFYTQKIKFQPGDRRIDVFVV